MKKYTNMFVVSILVFSLFSLYSMVLAEETRTAPTTRAELEQLKDDLKLEREEARAKMEATREENKEKRENLQEENRVKIEQAKAERELLREEAKAKMETLKVKVTEEKDLLKAKLQEERIVGRQQALERFDKAVENVTKMKERVSANIETFKAKGVDVSVALTHIALAESFLGQVEGKVTEMNTLLASSVEQLSEETKTQIRTLAKEAQELLKSAHTSLKDAVLALKEAGRAKMEEIKKARAEVKNQKDTEDENEGEENSETTQ